MARVNKDNFEVFVGSILVNPVRVQHTEVATDTTSTLFSDTAQVPNEFQLVNTLVLWLSVNDTLMIRSLAATTTNGNTVYDIALFGFIS